MVAAFPPASQITVAGRARARVDGLSGSCAARFYAARFRERKMEQQGRILDGDLETLGLQATLKMLALGGKTGVLLVSSGQEHLKITLENGQILALDEPHIPPPDVIEIFFLLDKIDADLARLLHQQSGNNSATALMLMAQSRLISPE